jgi:hypothetical protein
MFFPIVADPGCLLFIPDPDLYSSRNPDFGSRIQKQQQKRGLKKISCPTFFCSHKNHNIENYINFELVKEKIWANLQRIIELSTQKLALSSQKYGFRFRDTEKKADPDPGVKRHRIPEPDPQHCF